MNFYIKRPYNSPICYYLALNYYHKKEYDNAIKYCTNALLNDG